MLCLFVCIAVELLPLEQRSLLKWKISTVTPNIVKHTISRSHFKVTKSELIHTCFSKVIIAYIGDCILSFCTSVTEICCLCPESTWEFDKKAFCFRESWLAGLLGSSYEVTRFQGNTRVPEGERSTYATNRHHWLLMMCLSHIYGCTVKH